MNADRQAAGSVRTRAGGPWSAYGNGNAIGASRQNNVGGSKAATGAR